MFNFLHFNLEQIAFLVLVNFIVLNKEICNNFQYMRLKKRNEHKYTILVVQYSNDFIEVSITHLDSSLFSINCNSIKSSLIDSILELFIFICFHICDITDLVDKWKTFRLILFHLLHDLLFIIHAGNIKI